MAKRPQSTHQPSLFAAESGLATKDRLHRNNECRAAPLAAACLAALCCCVLQRLPFAVAVENESIRGSHAKEGHYSAGYPIIEGRQETLLEVRDAFQDAGYASSNVDQRLEGNVFIEIDEQREDEEFKDSDLQGLLTVEVDDARERQLRGAAGSSPSPPLGSSSLLSRPLDDASDGTDPSGTTNAKTTQQQKSLATPTDGHGGHAGVMFEIKAQTDLVVETLDIRVRTIAANAGNNQDVPVKVYTKPGPLRYHLAYITARANTWTKVCDRAVVSPSGDDGDDEGGGVLASIPDELFTNVAIRAGDTQAFYVSTSSQSPPSIVQLGTEYTGDLGHWVDGNPPFVGNDDLSVLVGAGVPNLPWFDPDGYLGRGLRLLMGTAWNGRVRYSTVDNLPPRPPASQQTQEPPRPRGDVTLPSSRPQPNVIINVVPPNAGINLGRPNAGFNIGRPNVGNGKGRPNTGTVPIIVSPPVGGSTSASSSTSTTTSASASNKLDARVRDANSGSYGNMFDATASSPSPTSTSTSSNGIVVTSMDVDIYTTDIVDVEVWTRTDPGSHVGYETREDAWRLWSSATVRGMGNLGLTHIPAASCDNDDGDGGGASAADGVVIGPGETRAFYVTLRGPYLRYANGHRRVGDVYAWNDDVSVSEGTAVGRYRFGGLFSPRLWNGVLHYSPLVSGDDDNRTSLPSPSTSLEIASNFQGETGSYGIMYDVKALGAESGESSAVLLKGLDIHTYSTRDVQVEVYTKLGTHIGSEGNQDDWTLVQTATVQGQGLGQRTTLPDFTIPLRLDAGQTRALYVTLTDPTQRYSKGTAEGMVSASTDHLQLLEGSGVGAYKFGRSYKPRVFSGAVRYSVLPNE